jgi:hypothetical protein
VFCFSQINQRNRKTTQQNVEMAIAVSKNISHRQIDIHIFYSVKLKKIEMQQLIHLHAVDVHPCSSREYKLTSKKNYNNHLFYFQAAQTKEELIRELHSRRAAEEEAAAQKKLEEQRLLVGILKTKRKTFFLNLHFYIRQRKTIRQFQKQPQSFKEHSINK